MKEQFEWELVSGSGSFEYDDGQDTYAVKYGAFKQKADTKDFSSRSQAELFYESIQPESLRYGKALWQHVGGCLPELIFCHETREAS